MNKKICVTSTRAVGCTFIDWSLHFLSGQNDFYQSTYQSWLPLNQNPITKNNSHGHLKNHPAGQKNLESVLKLFDAQSQDRFYTVYPISLHLDKAAQELGIDLSNVGKDYKILKDYISKDYNRLLETCYQQNTKLIFVATDPRVPFYFLHPRSLDRGLLKLGPINSSEAYIDEIQNIFFTQSINTWNKLGLTNIWDIRERRALDLRIYSDSENFATSFKSPHLWINSVDFWTRGKEVIHDIMNYAELEILQDKFESWSFIYKNWQDIQLNALKFDYNCDHIIDAIINNWYYQIDLTFEQEIVIQHLLIYKHNLNLKTWELTKFPNNTQDLHKLLESNIHSIPDIY